MGKFLKLKSVSIKKHWKLRSNLSDLHSILYTFDSLYVISNDMQFNLLSHWPILFLIYRSKIKDLYLCSFLASKSLSLHFE